MKVKVHLVSWLGPQTGGPDTAVRPIRLLSKLLRRHIGPTTPVARPLVAQTSGKDALRKKSVPQSTLTERPYQSLRPLLPRPVLTNNKPYRSKDRYAGPFGL